MPGADEQRLVKTQRTATLRHLQDLTKLKRASSEEAARRNEPAWFLVLVLVLVLDNLVYAAEAEIRWLDHVQSRHAREATRAPEVRTRDTESSYDDQSSKRTSR